jgi:ankyrin repeat protein
MLSWGPLERRVSHLERTQQNKTALIAAAEMGHTDCVRLLLDAGAEAKDMVRVGRFFAIFMLFSACLCFPSCFR